VGYILGNDERHGITILVVNTRGKIDKEKSNTIFENAIKHITDNGFSPDTISTQFIASDRTADSIIKIAKEGQFAAVAVGHGRKEQGFFKKLFSGSVCSTLFRELEHAALWIHH
jgi:nucleotide-binding universal stress UspA family protein